MADLVLNSDIKQALVEVEKNESTENIIKFITKANECKEKAVSELVLEYGIKLMADSGEIEKIENFKVLEEVFFSALTCKAFDWADLLLLIINNQIPKSPKSLRYLAMFKQAQGKDEEAKNVYRELLKANPEDYPAYKRLAAFLRDTELKDEAIGTLNCLLKINMTDTHAWYELAEMYIAEMNYAKAAFCFEEILIQKPTNHLYNIKYAELLYSMGGGENLILARKYYSKAITLNDNASEASIMSGNKSVRAIFGLLETCKRLESMSKKYQDEVNQDLIIMCKEKLEKLYATSKFDISQLS